mmetsp:Transcript_33548/g.111979  ORF Transcript_33548/g.111979 Transcript_33548/m.111979 type:complete len:161 (+) Transcript_33548:85-567(+)
MHMHMQEALRKCPEVTLLPSSPITNVLTYFTALHTCEITNPAAPSQLSSVKAAAPRCGRAGGAAAMRTSPRPSRQRRPIVRGGRPGACLRLLLPATRSLAPLLGGGGRVGRPCVVQPAVGGRSAQAGGSDALVQSCADVEARAEQRGRLERRALHLADAS